MAVNTEAYLKIKKELDAQGITLVAVSKMQTPAAIMELYQLGQRDFGENYVQEMMDKQMQLPLDIRWHFIGHLQRNKVKYIAAFVALVHGVDSFELLQEINKQAAKNNRVIPVLLQMHIAKEATKFGLDENEMETLIADLADVPLKNVRVDGMMGMATFTDDIAEVRREFGYLKDLFQKYDALKTSAIRFRQLSMGMSGDYAIAAEQGSTMVRIGSLLFGARSTKF